MATGRQPENGKSPAKRSKTGKGGRKGPPGKARRKPGRKGGGGGKPIAPLKLPSVPLLAVWVVAIIFLTALIYFSRNSGHHLSEVHIPTSKSNHVTDNVPAAEPGPDPQRNEPEPLDWPHGKKTESANPTASVHVENSTPESAPPKLPPGPVLPPKPVFSSRDIPADSHSPRQGSLSIALNKPSSTLPVPAPPVPSVKPSVARIAIVIDDFGQDLGIAKKFLLLPFPVAFSILPYQTHSKEIAELVHSHGKEVLLHCPMEPIGYPKVDPGRGALLLSMSEDTIRQNVRTALDSSPYFTGVNNHMGSRMTQNEAAMKAVLGEVNQRGLFFIDSCTTPGSIAYSVARELKIPSRKRDIFLDNNVSSDSIRSQVSRLIRKARIEGTALAIGHPHEATLKALQEASGQFGEQGIEIVRARDLMSDR
jgi:uncharacterized protein